MAAPLSGRRILVLEDNFLLAEVLSDLLEDNGCVLVGPAPRVQSALRLCDASLDGALLDINLGRETCFAVADRLVERGVPFIFLSGYTDADAVPDRFRSVPRLTKPYDRQQIVVEAERRFGKKRGH